MWSLATAASLAFFAPTVRLESNQQLSLHGRGPPVLFSSGLFGLMPRRIYSQLFRALGDRVTLAVLDDAAPVTADVAREAAAALGVDRVGFLAHSSFDARILEVVGNAVLCDPVVLPDVGASLASGFANGVAAAPSVRAAGDVLVLRAGRAYEDEDGAAIPDFLAPRLADATRLARVETFDGVGHADLLDDPWADLGPRALPWMRGAAAVKRVPFREWTFRRHDRRDARADYRARLADAAATHLLADDSEAVAHHVLVEVE